MIWILFAIGCQHVFCSNAEENQRKPIAYVKTFEQCFLLKKDIFGSSSCSYEKDNRK